MASEEPAPATVLSPVLAQSWEGGPCPEGFGE